MIIEFNAYWAFNFYFSLGAGNNGGGVLRTISESVSQKEAQGKGGRHAVIRR